MPIEIKHLKVLQADTDLLVLAATGYRELVNQGHADPEHGSMLYTNIPCLVAYDDGMPVGFISYFRNDNENWWVSFSYVAPSHRKQGIWKQLWYALVERAQEKDIERIEGGTNVDNKVMQAAYEAVGRKAEAITYTYKVPKAEETGVLVSDGG